MNRTFLTLAAIVMFGLMAFGGSCASDNNKDHDSGRDLDQPYRIPQGADVVREGTGKIKWTADMDGTFYVFDRDKNNIRFTGPVRRGDEIVVQPESDKIYVAGRVVFNENLEKHSTHKIYFIGDQQYDRNPK